MDSLRIILLVFNYTLVALFTIAYFHQYVYILIALFVKDKNFNNPNVVRHKITAIIPARNEELVIGNLIDSLRKQNYPSELIDIVVVADNCTDNTAQIAREKGVTVYERFNNQLVGMGYAFEWLFEKLLSDKSRKDELFLLTNADNLFAENYFEEINKVYDGGKYRVVTSYRNSKNYGDNWISACYGLWFVRESRFLNGVRMKIGTGCLVSGTGYIVEKKLLDEIGGWKFNMLTEDVQFSTYCALNKIKIGYASKAIFYDEQPTKFKMSLRQRLRWVKGYLQVLGKSGGGIMKRMFYSWTCYDIFTTIAPAAFITMFSFLVNIVFAIIGLSSGNYELASNAGISLGHTLGYFYIVLFLHGVITLIAEWKRINCHWFKKIMYLFLLPIFMFTYFPLFIAAIFKKNVAWKPITHNHVSSIESMECVDKKNNNKNESNKSKKNK